ncbi:MAG: acetyl-CoA carboxylase biotin carboxylase subunit [Elusimicrobia bacterium]|nr:acetyl-CoA carboxylase biotin carboxylase subunit [Elusimicrobiota bacterium]MBD3411818.1 acetyl-CoA carboxylase biotin carboxylase subunit [Elusimicrobiota bacterium]
MFKKILIANRGEIAVRIIRACREMGTKTVAVHSDVDRDCLHVLLADESICIGPGQAVESYLNIPNIISAAEISGADAIHPGYGFLAENTYFADVCASCGIKFIGPSVENIQKMGNKAVARQTAQKAGVPVVPGTEGCVSVDDPKLHKIAKKIGYPVMVKASAGGGGKGMRIVHNADELIPSILTAQSEAQAAFGNKDVYLEKYIQEPRHIEFQILGDRKGNVVYLPERDCSIQRRHQKLIEESPSPAVDSSLRKKMGKAARRIAQAIGYMTVGTVEFLLDKDEEFYFMEMNTRIQVEHPVTETLVGIDLVKEQIKLAAGEKIGYDSHDFKVDGHVIECRINSEDSEKDFIPSPGTVDALILPGGLGVRIDTHLYAGYTVPPFYDSLIAKLIVKDTHRGAAITRMLGALRDFSVRGIQTTTPFLQRVMRDDAFIRGQYSTKFIQSHYA